MVILDTDCILTILKMFEFLITLLKSDLYLTWRESDVYFLGLRTTLCLKANYNAWFLGLNKKAQDFVRKGQIVTPSVIFVHI